jgi:hypothetical protein
LRHFADVPLFADSRASRLIQAADFVAWALNRHYAQNDPQWLRRIAPHFNHDGDAMHGLIHISRDFATGSCTCPPCQNRLQRGVSTSA